MIDKQTSEYMCDVNMTFINSSQLIYICVIVKRTRSLTPKMFPVWNFVVGIFARKAMLNMDWVFSTFSCQYLCTKINYQ